jgi:hypothetical protein
VPRCPPSQVRLSDQDDVDEIHSKFLGAISFLAIGVALLCLSPSGAVAEEVLAADNATDADTDDEFSVPKLPGGSVQADEPGKSQRLDQFTDWFWELLLDGMGLSGGAESRQPDNR